jgi:type II secretory pathway pseudopilin PulG
MSTRKAIWSFADRSPSRSATHVSIRTLTAVRRRPAGLTLLELVVVMAILVAIAAVLVPLLPEYLGKGNQSAAATNMNELEKAIQTFRATYSRQPNYFDSLLDGSNELSSLLPGAGTTAGPAGGELVKFQLGASKSTGPNSRLSREGITAVYDLKGSSTDSQFHATLNPYGASPTSRPLENGGYIVALASSTSIPGIILDSTHKYAVFGIGKYCNLCGPDGIVKESPVYGQHSQENTPSTVYQRFAAVYDIGPDDTNTDRYNAKFIGVVAIAADRLFSCGDLVGTYGDNRFDASQPRK